MEKAKPVWVITEGKTGEMTGEAVVTEEAVATGVMTEGAAAETEEAAEEETGDKVRGMKGTGGKV